jgi:hypothetical protein
MAKRLSAEVRAYFSKLGKKGGKKGGVARAAVMSPQQRQESARIAVLARWAKTKEARQAKGPSRKNSSAVPNV